MLKNPFTKNSIANEYKTLVNEINELETNLKTLTDGELKKKSILLQKQYKSIAKTNNSIEIKITIELFSTHFTNEISS